MTPNLRFMKCAAQAVCLAMTIVLFSFNASADAVSDWAVLAYTSSAANTPARVVPVQPRIAAMTNIAIHDALNGIDHRYAQYAYFGSDPSADPVAAIAAAGYNVLRYQNPTTAMTTQLALYTAQLASVPNGPAKDAGIALGEAAAAAITALRVNDGLATAQCAYTPGEAPGEWRPLAGQTFLLPCLGDVTPFTMKSGDRWRMPSPPFFKLTSKTYTREYEEVRIHGDLSNECLTPGQANCRSLDQSAAARYWGTGTGVSFIWTRIAILKSAQSNLDLWENGRLFAILGASQQDAIIAVWDSKRALPFWRPQAAIREADTDGNDDTDQYPLWTPVLGTPPYPDYNSGHSGADGAGAEVLIRFFETDDFSFTLPNGANTRSFTSFSGASVDAAESRIWGGIHFRSACEDALLMGNNVGRQAFNHYFRPVDEMLELEVRGFSNPLDQ